jgi:integrase
MTRWWTAAADPPAAGRHLGPGRWRKRPGSGPARWPGSATTPHDPRRSDLDLQDREIAVRGKGGRPRVVRIGHEAARALDRYIRVRARHVCAGVAAGALAGREQPRPDDCERDLPDDRPPGPAVRRGCLAAPVPASFQPHLAGPGRRGRRLDGAERLVLPADAAPLRRQRAQRPGSRTYNRVMAGSP